jgi:hypothetical protein
MTDFPEVLPGPELAIPATPDPTGAGEGAAEPKRSLREELEAQFAADGERQGAAEETSAAPAAGVPTGDKARNELGQFVKQEHKAGEPTTPSASGEPRAAAPKVESQALATGTAKPEAIAPPASWSPAAKAEFAKLPPLIQAEVNKREQDWNTGQAQRTQDAERLNRLHSVLGPRQEWLRLRGVDEARAVEQLFAASDFLDRDPVQALLYLARQTGVDPRMLAQAYVGNGTTQVATQPNDGLTQLHQKVQSLEQTLAQREQAAEQAQMDQLMEAVAQFAADPGHPYFENVRSAMSALVRSGEASSLDEAYERATWGHPEIRPILLQQQQETAAKAAREAAQAKVAQARHAAGSVTGSPTPGIDPGLNGSKRSLREELEVQWAEHS